MKFQLTSLEQLTALPFDTVIDVRSPSEYAEDHMPGAISLPVLDDEERARVGTIYTQVSPFLARKTGAALVARNAARHLEGPLAEKEGAWRPLVYCWRGGQRSGSFGSILAQVGWRTGVLEGGYQSYRRLVNDALYNAPLPHRLILLDGNTGTAKTDLLHLLASRGHQVLDLEGLANHRGSLLGAVGPQPAQKMFESRLAGALVALDPARPVIAEAESNKIGERLIPPSLWAAMRAAPRVELSAPLEARAEYLARRYASLAEDLGRLTARLDDLRPYHPRERIELWQEQARGGARQALALGLMEHHYDPRYAKWRERRGEAPAGTLALPSLDGAALEAAAERLSALVEKIPEAALRPA